MICGRGRKRVRNHSKNSFEALTPTFNDASRGVTFTGWLSSGGEDVSALQGRGDAGVLDWGSGLSVPIQLDKPQISATEFGLCPGEIEKLLKKIKPEPENRHLEVAKK